MVAWGKEEDESDRVAVFTGVADWDGKCLRMRRERGGVFEVRPEWWERIRPANAEVREIVLQAEFCFSVAVGDVEDAGDGLEKTGLKWPD